MALTISEPAARQDNPSNGMHNLAPELLSSIFQRVRLSANRRNFTSCLLVCRHWFEVGSPYAWGSICLDNDALEIFVESARNSPRGCDLVRSLTLQLNTIWPTVEEFREWRFEGAPNDTGGANPRTYQLWSNLDTLAHIIRSNMTGLVSFSLCVSKFPPGGRTGEYWSDPSGAWVKTGTIADLLHAIPRSCVDLELDTRGREDDRACNFCPVYGSTHLCPVIRGLLPRLRHVRLRLGTLCSRLFLAPRDEGVEHTYTQAAALLSLTVNLNIEPNSGRTLRYAVIQSDDHERDYGLLQKGLGKVLRDAYKANAFPRARAIQTMDIHRSERRQHDHATQQDIIEDRTYLLPFRKLWIDDGTLDDETFVGHNAADEEFFGTMTELEPILEDSAWVTTVDGDRWSSDLQSSASHRVASLRAPRFETRAEFLGRCESRFPAWAVNAWKDAKDCHSETEEGLCG